MYCCAVFTVFTVKNACYVAIRRLIIVRQTEKVSVSIKLLNWIWGVFWPILVIAMILAIHVFVFNKFDVDAENTNKLVSLIAQVIGGALILYSIDSNIELYKGKKLGSVFLENLRRCPLLKRSTPLQAKAKSRVIATGNLSWKIHRDSKTVNEKLEYLQEQIDQLNKQLSAHAAEVDEKIKKAESNIKVEIDRVKIKSEELEAKVIQSVTNGISVQIFGFLLVIYGGVCGYIA